VLIGHYDTNSINPDVTIMTDDDYNLDNQAVLLDDKNTGGGLYPTHLEFIYFYLVMACQIARY
jgi:hypothetical protein